MKTLMTSLMVVSISLTAGCATRQAAVPANEASEPRLIACAERTPERATVPRTSVELRYDVDTEGRVTTVRVVQNMNSNLASDATIAAAKNLALGCRYEPALRDGKPVTATVSRWVTVEDAGAKR